MESERKKGTDRSPKPDPGRPIQQYEPSNERPPAEPTPKRPPTPDSIGGGGGGDAVNS